MQVTGRDQEANRAYAAILLAKIRTVPGIADARIHQSSSSPQLNVDVDRSHMSLLGLSERDVTNSVTTPLAGSSQTAPTFWLNPATGVSYPIVAQTPEYKLDTIDSLQNLPVTGAAGADGAQVLGGIGKITRGQTSAVVTHYDIQPTIDLFAVTQDRDLGAVAADVQKILKDEAHNLPKGASVTLRGQVATMQTTFQGLFFGLGGAVVLI